ncbi:hypothetical protein [Streptomyces lienomycini]|uniref:Secreted protein n=1 Tax=Streptomyces lienomycini TaxID=284035 RepID=A0ABV9WMA8_9ACTN|nr:hypothetical protein [Streptomyces lienomycini]
MRRTARAVSVAVLASAALGVFAGSGAADPGVPPPPADAGNPVPPPPGDAGNPVAPPPGDDPGAVLPRPGDDAAAVPPPPGDDAGVLPPPSAEEALPPATGRASAQVSPADVAPGGTVTVSVSCGPTGGTAPDTLEATSPAFDEGTVALRKVAADAGTASGTAYRGTARIAAAEDFRAERSADDAADTESPNEGPVGADEGLSEAPEGAADDWTVDGACPDASGGEGDPWSATMTVPGESGAGAAEPACRESAAPRAGTSTHGTPCATTEPPCPGSTAPRAEPSAQGRSCGGATAEHGVRAGTGGTFSDSVPALVAGAVLIAGACGAAAHRLRLRLRGEGGEH